MTVFVTGGTGLLGSALAEAYARQGRPVLFLVRPHSVKPAETWLRDLRRGDDVPAGRIVLLQGDLADDRVLLADRARERVCSEVDLVLHCGAATHLALDGQTAASVNVEGTRRMLDLAREIGGLRRFVHFSAGAVAGDAEGDFGEDECERGQRFYGHYARSKHAAEVLVRAAQGRLPITILRPSHVVGRSTDGVTSRVDGIYHLFLLLVRIAKLPRPLRVLPVVPGGDAARIDLVPQDWVVQATMALAEDPRAEGTCCALSDPDARTVRALASLVCGSLGIAGPYFSIPGRPLAMLLRGSDSGRLRTLLDQLLSLPPELADGLAHRARYRSDRTQALLAPLGLQAPALPSYLDRLLAYTRDSLL